MANRAQVRAIRLGFEIQDAELRALGSFATLERNERIRQCIAQHFERQLRDDRQRVPARKEQFTLTASDLRNCQPNTQESPKRWLCTVQLPMRGASPEFHDLVVSDYANAVTILERRLPANPRYDWNSASVVKREPKE